MITQNLFYKKPKTFMDYELGKVPSKKEWDKQTTTQAKTYNPFASNVKLVGDDMTEKDYDDFFEGFSDPWGEKREQDRQRKEQERKESFANIRANADNLTLTSQSSLSSKNHPLIDGFNQDSTAENKCMFDALKEKTTGILNPDLSYEADRTFRGSQFEGELKPTVQRLNSSPTITNAINRNLNAKNEYKPLGTYDPNQEPVATCKSQRLHNQNFLA